MFNAIRMAKDYLLLYTDVLNGSPLHNQTPVMRETANQLPWLR